MDNEFFTKLRKKAEEYDIELEEKQLRSIEDYRNILLDWNKKVNLTRITEIDDFIEKHVIDSMMVTKLVEIKKGASIIDVGTGPGIPGFFLKIARPDIRLILLETVRKKTDFLMEVVEKLEINDIEVLNERAENAAKKKPYRETYDIAVARAVSSMNVLSEFCLPFVKTGGIFVAMKGEKIEEEVKEAKNSLDILGGKIRDIKEYKIGQAKRKLVIIEKINNTPEKYPRRPGMPEKNPL
ncbi:MAG TPA: 16S rRNA (guanine(527)-N(7))-methyltransferase RsmG [Thermoanaerobacterales bacterium]|nr:16S rRNA (guanine(527)-N(7))-methyltransferase RsmG [Thermoanaerobacterales bacterium]